MIRWCDDIGMFALDRSRKTCLFRTEFCAKHCYNGKLYTAFGHNMIPKDYKSDMFWESVTGPELRSILARKRNQTNRIRLCTRGEPISSHSDITNIRLWANANPYTIFWIPTRAWRNAELRARIRSELCGVRNLRIMASTDPSNTHEEIDSLKADGWSTMFFGDDTRNYGFLCPKTWRGKKSHCAICRGGCFSPRRVDVHLKAH